MGSTVGVTDNTDSAEDLLRVKASSNPQKLASAIAHAVYDSRQVTLRAIGAGAVNQAVKAIAIARGYVATRGHDLHCVPGFVTVALREGDMSAIIFKVVAV